MRYTEMLNAISQELSKRSEQKIDVCLDSLMAYAIEQWEALYQDRAPWLSAKKGIYSAGIPGAVASEMARLVTLEMASKVEGDDYINGIYQNSLKNIRIQTEYACAGGGLVFKPYPVNDSITVQYIRANGFFPISFDSSGRITKGVFVEQIRAGKTIYTRLEVHTLDKSGLIIENLAYKSLNDKVLGGSIDLTSVEAWADIQPVAHFDGVEKLPIGYFKIPMANTIDPDSPLGVSVFSRARGLIKEADKRYSNLCWELEATEAAVHIAESMLKRDKEGNLTYPEGKERLYRALSYNMGPQDKALIDKYSPDIRIDPLYKAYQAQLKIIEFDCGLAYGTLSDPQETDKTAEEIRSSKQRSYATVTDIQMALQSALVDLIDAIAFWSKQSDKSVSDYTTSFSWDDSIVVDSNAVANRSLLEFNAGIIDQVRYFQQVYGMAEEAAIKLAAEIKAREPAPMLSPFTGA